MEPKTPIVTRRLRLRPFKATDIDDVLAYHSRAEVAQFQYWEPRTRSEVEDKVHEWSRASMLVNDGDVLILAVEMAERNTVIGDVTLFLRSVEARQGEIGFSFHTEFGGRGLATEAVRALVDWGFREAKLHRIFGRCDAKNERSWKLMERLGFRCEAHFHEHARFKGQWDEEFLYAILEREWFANAQAGN